MNGCCAPLRRGMGQLMGGLWSFGSGSTRRRTRFLRGMLQQLLQWSLIWEGSRVLRDVKGLASQRDSAFLTCDDV